MSDIDSRIAATRAELEATLDAIEDKLNVPRKAARLRDKAVSAYRKNPVPWLAGSAAAVASVVGAVLLAQRSHD
jgi:hypothetical protein